MHFLPSNPALTVGDVTVGQTTSLTLISLAQISNDRTALIQVDWLERAKSWSWIGLLSLRQVYATLAGGYAGGPNAVVTLCHGIKIPELPITIAA